MITSAVDICNLALSHIGDAAEVISIVPPDGSIQSAQCARFYPITINVMLESYPWTFATKRVDIAEIVNPYAEDWSYAYAIPSTCIRPLSCLLPGRPEQYFDAETDSESLPYIVEAAQDGSLILLTNVETAVLRYIDTITDPSKFTPAFVIAASHLLASYLAGPIIKGPTGVQVSQAQLKLFQFEYQKATAFNANIGKRNGYQTRIPSAIAARGYAYIRGRNWGQL